MEASPSPPRSLGTLRHPQIPSTCVTELPSPRVPLPPTPRHPPPPPSHLIILGTTGPSSSYYHPTPLWSQGGASRCIRTAPINKSIRLLTAWKIGGWNVPRTAAEDSSTRGRPFYHPLYHVILPIYTILTFDHSTILNLICSSP